MLFIVLLLLSAAAIAGSAAYFSVYGLANTFSGVFWSVVIMGGSLEAGKLIAASYLYRYWDKTHALLRYYLMAGVAALMLLTSGGIFGYLSSGYQADVLPLKQMEAQTKLLEEEKTRKYDRKKQIDDLIAKVPSVGNINRPDGTVDQNAVRALTQAQRNRDALVAQYKTEQQELTKRSTEIDKELLTLRQSVIKAEAHVGPITYISKAFNVDTDDATKWLVFLIIFAFDPMAVALTLAVNIALRVRIEEKEAETPHPVSEPKEIVKEVPVDKIVYVDRPVEVIKEVLVDKPVEIIKEVPVDKIVYVDKPIEVIKEVPIEKIVYVDRLAPEVVEPIPEPVQTEEQFTQHIRAYPELWKTYVEGTSANEKIDMLLTHYKGLKGKKSSGVALTKDETWEMGAIEQILKRKGLDVYLK